MTTQTLSPFELRDCDLQRTAAFLSQIFGGLTTDYLSCFQHWWGDNPAWNRFLPRGWIVRSTEGSVIAFTVNIPFLYRINGVDALACATGSTAVDERWRGQGLSKLVGSRFLNQPSVDLLIGTGSTDIAYRLWLSLGMTPLRRSWPDASYIIPGSFRSLCDTYGSKMKKTLRRGGALLDIICDTIPPLIRSTVGLDIMKVAGFEPADDPDLCACRASEAATFALRDAKIMNWLYFGSPYIRTSRVVLVAKSAQRIVGYIAMKRQLHSLLLLECRVRNADVVVAKSLFWAAQEYARRNAVAYIRVWRYSSMINSAVPRICRIERLSPPMMTYCYKANRSVDETDWEAAPGDGDQSVN